MILYFFYPDISSRIYGSICRAGKYFGFTCRPLYLHDHPKEGCFIYIDIYNPELPRALFSTDDQYDFFETLKTIRTQTRWINYFIYHTPLFLLDEEKQSLTGTNEALSLQDLRSKVNRGCTAYSPDKRKFLIKGKLHGDLKKFYHDINKPTSILTDKDILRAEQLLKEYANEFKPEFYEKLLSITRNKSRDDLKILLKYYFNIDNREDNNA